MPVAEDIQVQLETIDQQIIRLLEERRRLCAEIEEQELVEETVAYWLDEAASRGLDEIPMERIARLVVKVSERGEE